VQAIEQPQQKHALRLTAHLLVGISKIHSSQVGTARLDRCCRRRFPHTDPKARWP
jgi:hypothetical protein